MEQSFFQSVKCNRLKASILFCVAALAACPMNAQNLESNPNNTESVLSNQLNVQRSPIPTGPNGPGGMQQFRNINVNVDNNDFLSNVGVSGGPNVQGFTSLSLPQVQQSVRPNTTVTKPVTKPVNKPKPKVVNQLAAKPSRPTPRPTVKSNPAPKPKVVNQLAAKPSRPAPRPTVKPNSKPKPVAVVPKPAVVASAPPPAAIELSRPNIQVREETKVVAASVAPTVQQIVSNVSTPAPVSAPATQRVASSGGSGSSGKSHHALRKRHGSLSYTASKKFRKFFAHNKKGKFDPAKCFVWS